MTWEETLRLTGFKQVGEDKNTFGRGLLFGFPSEVTLGGRSLTFTCGLDAKPDSKQLRAIGKRLKENEYTKGKITVTPSAPGDASGTVGKFFVITVTFGKDDLNLWFHQAMQILETVLREGGITVPERCHICQQGGVDALAYYDGRPSILHMNCLRQWKDTLVEGLEQKKYESGHFRGVIGGLIGGVVGAIPALLALNFLEYFVAVLFAIIPVGIYFGWKWFGGRLSRATTVFTIVYTLIVAVVVDVVDSWLILRAEFPQWQLTLMEVIELYLNPDIFRENFLASTLMSLFFSALGIFFVWRMITRTDQHEITDAQTIFDEAISFKSEMQQ